MKPRLLDLFCCAGGAAVGYARAGFEVVGVDITPQPNYPFEFLLNDALEFLRHFDTDTPNRYPRGTALKDFVAIHASPPCQHFTDYQRHGRVKPSPNLIPHTRALLLDSGLPYVIENVARARDELLNPLMLCGTMFDPPMEIQRHRLFESNVPIDPPVWPCRHKVNGVDRYPGGRSVARTGHSRGLVRGTVEIGSWDIPLETQKQAMGVDWDVTVEELSEAIPPSYTEFIGRQLLARIREQAAA